jgi:hypothetical protein
MTIVVNTAAFFELSGADAIDLGRRPEATRMDALEAGGRAAAPPTAKRPHAESLGRATRYVPGMVTRGRGSLTSDTVVRFRTAASADF